MNNVNTTLYIPLYGKAFVSKRGLFLSDKRAEEIWEAEGFKLRGKAASKWLAYYMGIRARVFDEWVKEKIGEVPGSVVIHIGCGMDSRVTRVGADRNACWWYDVDFPEVIEERRRYFAERDGYKMLGCDVRCDEWLKATNAGGRAIVVMEGVSMYLTAEEMRGLTESLCARFGALSLITDAYTTLAARMSRRANPVNTVGVTEVYGIDSPSEYASGALAFLKEHTMIPQKYVDELSGVEGFIFGRLYAGGFSKKLYRLYEYEKR